jgi:hypothetical protein
MSAYVKILQICHFTASIQASFLMASASFIYENALHAATIEETPVKTGVSSGLNSIFI